MNFAQATAEMPVKYGKPASSEMSGLPGTCTPTELILFGPTWAYCVGPDWNVWCAPIEDVTPVSDPSSYLWGNFRNLREEDEYHNGPVVPEKIEKAHIAVAVALSAMSEMSALDLSDGVSQTVRDAGKWIFDLIDWDAVYSDDESGKPGMSE